MGMGIERSVTTTINLLESQRDGALQLLAALTLTDEEIFQITLKRNPNAKFEQTSGWAKSIRTELLSEFKDTLLDVLTRFQFLQNSHPGYALSGFEAPDNTYGLLKAKKDLQAISDDYASGLYSDIESVEGSMDSFEKSIDTFLSERLKEKGNSEDCIKYVMLYDKVIFLIAVRKRIMNKKQDTK